MSAESKIYAALSGAPGVTALVGSRIKPALLPQGEQLPAIVFTRAETDYVMTIHSAAALGSTAGMDIWCIAETFTGAESTGDAVEVALAAAGITVTGRRPDVDPQTEAFSTVISCMVWS